MVCFKCDEDQDNLNCKNTPGTKPTCKHCSGDTHPNIKIVRIKTKPSGYQQIRIVPNTTSYQPRPRNKEFSFANSILNKGNNTSNVPNNLTSRQS